MNDAGAIDKKVFALGLRDASDQAGSFMDLGLWDSSVITSTSDLAWIDVSKGLGAWANTLQGIRFRHQV